MPRTTQHQRRAAGATHERLDRLLRQQDELLQSQRERLRGHRRAEAGGVNDVEEDSANASEESVGLSIQDLTAQRVQEIEAALWRIGSGAFGTCADCRSIIPASRLRAIPFAARCLACQRAYDIGRLADDG